MICILQKKTHVRYVINIISVSEPARFQKHYSCHSCTRHLNSLAWYSVRRPCISFHSFASLSTGWRWSATVTLTVTLFGITT